MNQELSRFAARLREAISSGFKDQDFDAWAVELFYLQFQNCPIYQRICRMRGVDPTTISVRRQTTPSSARWKEIPFAPTGAFKEMDVSSIPAAERIVIFQSSGTTEQKRSRHFHCPESLAVYEASLWQWFRSRFVDVADFISLTPQLQSAPHSSLVHMFETIRRKLAQPRSAFIGNIGADGSWAVDFSLARQRLHSACDSGRPLTILGTAFSFVHLLDYLTENDLRFELPAGSRVMETGGYKNRSRVLPKAELHKLIVESLGVLPKNIVCEYGMSELSSQAYAGIGGRFQFPPWARMQIISPETGREVADSETGLIRVFDLANVFSVAATQTEDVGIRRGDGFELIGRAASAEPRGCSLNSPESSN